MSQVLLDTHAWAWSLIGDAQLSDKATAAMTQAETVLVSSISLFEIGQKVQAGKWPEMVPFVGWLTGLADAQGVRFIAVSPDASLLAATLEWGHWDPFDRIIGATAITKGLALVSADTAFDCLAKQPGWLGRLW